jgi:hypothetical protein
MAGNVHVHHMWRFPNQMIMDSGFMDAALLELHHDGFDLVFSENQVAHYHRAVAITFEGCPRTQGQSRLNIDAVEHDVEVLSRHPELDHIPWLHLAGAAHRVLDLLPITLRGANGSGASRLCDRQGSAQQASCRKNC